MADNLLRSLPVDAAARARQLERGYAAATRMSWDRVCETQFLPALQRLESSQVRAST